MKKKYYFYSYVSVLFMGNEVGNGIFAGTIPQLFDAVKNKKSRTIITFFQEITKAEYDEINANT
jgi:hypothetical protein